jgi:lysophospholipase L1-like esterase
MEPRGQDRRPLTRRVWMSVVVSLTLLLGIELGLRLLIGPPKPILGLIPVSQVTLVEQGDEVVLSHLIDTRQDARVPRERGDRPRVVFLGGSSVRHTYSVPDDHNFPSHVQALAPELEILNLASPGQTTPTLAALVEHLDALNPDLIVLHTGHNDYADVVFAGVPRWDNPLLNAVIGLGARSALFSSLAERLALERVRGHLPTRSTGAVMRVVQDDLSERTLHRRTEKLIADVRRLIAQSPAPVMLTTLWRSFEHPPSATNTEEDPGHCQQTLNTQLNPHSRSPEAEPLIVAACGVESTAALWIQARALAAQSQHAEAARRWGLALSRSPLPLAAPLDADDALRALAAADGLCLADLNAALGPFPKDGHFTDAVHLNPRGARAVAEAITPALRACLAQSPGAGSR